MLHLAFIHFFVRFLSNLSRKSIRNNKKSDGHLHWFCFRHFIVLKDISTEYFIQMNKARLCCTLIIFSDGSLRIFLTLFRFLLLHSIPYANEKGCSKILSCRHTLRFLPQAHCQRLCFKRVPFLRVNDCTFEPSFRYKCFFWSPFNFCFHIHVFLQDRRIFSG